MESIVWTTPQNNLKIAPLSQVCDLLAPLLVGVAAGLMVRAQLERMGGQSLRVF